MTDVKLVDVSLRDGNQSIWGATGVTTRMVQGVAPLLDQVGYHAIELVSSTLMATAVRYHQEDPWERLRAARDLMPNTQLGFLTTGKRFISFHRTPDAVFELAFRLLVRNGVKRLWVIDPMHDMDGAKRTAEMAKRVGFEEVIGGICYTTSPVHTDEYFATKAKELDDCDAIDSVYLKDPAGLLTPWLLVCVASSVAAFYASARGLQDGDPVPVIAITGTAANVAGIFGGIIVFGDPLSANPLTLGIECFAFCLVIAAAWLMPAPVRARGAAVTA